MPARAGRSRSIQVRQPRSGITARATLASGPLSAQHPTADLPGVIRTGPGQRHPTLMLVDPPIAASLLEAIPVEAVGWCSGGAGESVEKVAERVGERGAGHRLDGTRPG